MPHFKKLKQTKKLNIYISLQPDDLNLSYF